MRGCAQEYGIDYKETYTPVIKHSSLRVLFALSAKYGLKIEHLNVVTAHLQGDLEEEIHGQPPKEIVDGRTEKRVWKLRKLIYGLTQSGQSWNMKLKKGIIRDRIQAN